MKIDLTRDTETKRRWTVERWAAEGLDVVAPENGARVLAAVADDLRNALHRVACQRNEAPVVEHSIAVCRRAK